MPPDPIAITRGVVAHFRRHHRALPWRTTCDPYRVWVSELMLQQTRVATAIPYFERWMERFPTVHDLAAAPVDDVLAAWAGLGYYRRARYLHAGAADVVARYGGRLPREVEQLRTLPGVGRYTAGAIASIAFGAREPVVDGNVARVLARVYAIEDDVKSTATQRRLWQLASALVPARDPGQFNQGLMELGATICTPTNPACARCPIAAQCLAHATNRTRDLPVTASRVPAKDLPRIDLVAAWVVRRGKLLLMRRTTTGLYGGMWELPQDEAGDGIDLGAVVGVPVTLIGPAPALVHRQQLSHRRLRVSVWRGRLGRGRITPAPRRYDRFAWQPLESVSERPLSAGTTRIAHHFGVAA